MALVLTRKSGESIKLGDDITIRVQEIRSDGSVRIAIDAPRSVRVLRGELADAVAAENRAATVVDEEALLTGLARLRR